MVYSFKQPHSIEEQFRSIADYQIGEGLAALESSEANRADIVHDVRKRCKKLRGLIRLVGPSFAGYKEENAVFKQVGHLFDDLRDAKVMEDTYDLLINPCAEQIDLQAFANIRRELTILRDNLSTHAEWESRKVQAMGLLIAARERAQEWSLSAEGWDALHGGVAKTYGRARKARSKARKNPSGPNHHEWRKQAKYHLCHASLLKRAFPKMMKLHTSLLQDLTDELGVHHDIHVFGELLDRKHETFGDEASLAIVRDLADRKSALFEDRVARSGARLFADAEDALMCRWAAWWCVWRAEVAHAHAT